MTVTAVFNSQYHSDSFINTINGFRIISTPASAFILTLLHQWIFLLGVELQQERRLNSGRPFEKGALMLSESL